MTLAADPLDDFLAGAGAGTDLGELLETIGLLLALPGIVIAIGLVAFVYFVLTPSSVAETRVVGRTLAVCGVLTLVGGLVESVGAVAIGAGTWIDDLANTWQPLLRLMSGALMTVGFLGNPPPVSEVARSKRLRALGVIGVMAGALSFATDGHTVSRGDVLLNASLDVVHVLAAGVWVGGIAGLVIMAVRRRVGIEDGPLAPAMVRFSTVATLAIVSLAAAGAGMSLLIVDSVSDYWKTDWGRLLLVKVALVGAAGGLGGYNHFVVVPGLEVDPANRALLSRAKRTIGAEAVILLIVTLVTVFLTGASIDQ